MALPDDFPRAALTAFSDVTQDSNTVTPNCLFACVVGTRFDGHDFAAQAVASGATGLLAERSVDVDGVPVYQVANVRAAMGEVAAIVHGRPTDELKLVGVTGTNGKTTISHLLSDALNTLGIDTGEIGTLSGTRTTPEAPDLQRLLRRFVNDGFDAVAMEVSSHALVQNRVDGCRFDVVVFSNLSRDHLDLHKTLESYFEAKAWLFDPGLASLGVVNRDDVYGRRLIETAPIPIVTYGEADAADVTIGLDRVAFTWRGLPTELGIGGSVNLSNALATLTVLGELGITEREATEALRACKPVPGRFESIPTDRPFKVIVDYAHTPDAIAALIATTRILIGHGRIIIVSGAGGDRDQDKRPMMGIAASAADFVIVTSDNPRHEDPLAIIDAIAAGIDTATCGCLIEPDRRAAIELAVSTATEGDVVLIVGKGHETTQTIGDRAFPFDDRAVARAALEALT